MILLSQLDTLFNLLFLYQVYPPLDSENIEDDSNEIDLLANTDELKYYNGYGALFVNVKTFIFADSFIGTYTSNSCIILSLQWTNNAQKRKK